MRLLIGREYEVRVGYAESGEEIPGWFRAKYLTPHAKAEGWLWEIHDPAFSALGIEEVSVLEVRPLSSPSHHSIAEEFFRGRSALTIFRCRKIPFAQVEANIRKCMNPTALETVHKTEDER